jgi:hypothetical protein
MLESHVMAMLSVFISQQYYSGTLDAGCNIDHGRTLSPLQLFTHKVR